MEIYLHAVVARSVRFNIGGAEEIADWPEWRGKHDDAGGIEAVEVGLSCDFEVQFRGGGDHLPEDRPSALTNADPGIGDFSG